MNVREHGRRRSGSPDYNNTTPAQTTTTTTEQGGVLERNSQLITAQQDNMNEAAIPRYSGIFSESDRAVRESSDLYATLAAASFISTYNSEHASPLERNDDQSKIDENLFADLLRAAEGRSHSEMKAAIDRLADRDSSMSSKKMKSDEIEVKNLSRIDEVTVAPTPGQIPRSRSSERNPSFPSSETVENHGNARLSIRRRGSANF